MTTHPSLDAEPLRLTGRNRFPTFLLALLFFASPGTGCKRPAPHTNDPQLRAIDQLLDKQLPKGTSRARVDFFLNARGYRFESSGRDTIVAVVHHVDTETLMPSTARVTFHFGENDRLTSYELQPAREAALQP
jgi:hypothetical protein